jgi:putative flippase GtrA
MSRLSRILAARGLRRHSSRLARFGGVGVANTLADFSVYAGLLALGAPALAANAASFVVASGQSYVLNSRITFRDGGAPAPMSFGGYARFFAAHLMSLAISSAMIAVLAGQIGPLIAKASAIVFTFGLNYAMSAHFVFRRKTSQIGREGAAT